MGSWCDDCINDRIVRFLDLIDETGDICASIEKTIHIQNKQ